MRTQDSPGLCLKGVLHVGGGGVLGGTQKFVYQKWPKEVCSSVNVVFSRPMNCGEAMISGFQIPSMILTSCETNSVQLNSVHENVSWIVVRGGGGGSRVKKKIHFRPGWL